MKILKALIMLAILLWASTASAQNYYIVSDPQPGITNHKLVVDGTTGVTTYPAQPDGSARILLQGYTPGTPYIFELIAIDSSGWGGDTSDPLNATKPGKTLNVRIE